MFRLMRNTGFMRMAPRTTYKRSVRAWMGPWGCAGGNVVMGLVPCCNDETNGDEASKSRSS